MNTFKFKAPLGPTLHRNMAAQPVSAAALFVDFENVLREIQNKRLAPAGGPSSADLAISILQRLRNQLNSEPSLRVLLGRAYADWSPPLGESLNSLAFLSILPRHVVAKPQKNSADLELSLEALETMLTRPDIDRFVIVGGDRDYIPVVRRLQENGRTVTIASFRSSVAGDLKELVGANGFIPLDDLERTGTTDSSPPLLTSSQAQSEPSPESPSQATRAPPQEAILSEENILKTLDLLLMATRGKEPPEKGLVRFFVEYMNDAFETLTNQQRKLIIGEIQRRGMIEVEDRRGEFHPNIVVVKLDHPVVVERLAHLPQSDQPSSEIDPLA